MTKPLRSALEVSHLDHGTDMPSVAVLLPCLNEGVTISEVVGNFQADLPNARIYVYDNNSTDDTAVRAAAAGAVVRQESVQGKGNVVRRMFADIDADVYVMADSDLTYDTSNTGALIDRLLAEKLDMIVGARQAQQNGTFPAGHRFGNRLFNRIVSVLFGSRFTDIFSGYRILSRRFVKSFPAVSRGFEIETELTVHALDLRVPVVEIPVGYRARPAGSHSKLRTLPDGLRILRNLILLCKEVRPLAFFSAWAALIAAVSIVLGYPIFVVWLETGLVPRFPTAILCTGLMIMAFLSVACGLILDSVGKGRHEAKRLAYLSLPPLPDTESRSRSGA